MTDAEQGPEHADEQIVTGELVEGDDNGDGGEADGDPREESIDQPTRLLRIAGMVRGLLKEVETTELDEAARERLGAIHGRSIAMLREIISDDLAAELDEVALDLGDDVPSGAELRVAQAQLAGWLEGLFHGIQASMASRQMASRSAGALRQAMGGDEGESGGGTGQGQYL